MTGQPDRERKAPLPGDRAATRPTPVHWNAMPMPRSDPAPADRRDRDERG